MHIFVTGATGWVGSAIVAELVGAGHSVSGLVRTAEKAQSMSAAGAQVILGSVDDHATLRQSVRAADAVIHTAFNHDFSKFQDGIAQDQHTIEIIGEALAGTDKPLLVTSGLAGLPRGAVETDLPNSAVPRQSELSARRLAEAGIRAATVRLAPSVHGIGDWGFVPMLIRMARETGVSAYPADHDNAWSGVHRLDAARLYRLALETGVTEPVYHAVADEAVPFKDIAYLTGKHLDLPVEPRDRAHFGWFANFAFANMAASSVFTRFALGWTPKEPGLLSDLDRPEYYRQ